MNRSAEQLRRDALRIWHAGVEAVKPASLLHTQMQIDGRMLCIGDHQFDLTTVEKIAVVGAGKASAGMAQAVEQILGADLMAEKNIEGWVNVPAGCQRPLQFIHLHPARPMGVNEPTAEGVAGTERILQIVSSLGRNDLCLCLISGGGSALLPAPLEGISLLDKQQVTRHLSDAGANIEQLNTVRKQLSRIKGGGLARQCGAGNLISLIISDVLGDPLSIIASGPTVEDSSTAAQALELLEQFDARAAGVSANVFAALAGKTQTAINRPTCRVENIVIGNNAVAVDAAGVEAERLGYSHAMDASTTLEGEAEGIGEHLAGMALRMQASGRTNCLITGGEPVVKLVDSSRRGRGGRNQQLTLAALCRIWEHSAEIRNEDDRIAMAQGLVILSGGTDGEDGPTDAAGAFFDKDVLAAAIRQNLVPQDFLARNDAYHFFEPTGGLIKTGLTHTNVCDLRVVLSVAADDVTS